jgi:hypothetical protein
MHADDEGDLGDVAMPGFVDILSSVVTVFMFFMLITSVTMFFLSLKMKKNVMEESKKEAQSDAAKELNAYLKKLEAGEITLEELKARAAGQQAVQQLSVKNTYLTESLQASEEALQKTRAAMGKTQNQKVETSLDSTDLIIIYDESGITVNPDTIKIIKEFITRLKQDPTFKDKTLLLESPDNPAATTQSLSRELSLGRSLNVRNVLLLEDVFAERVKISNVPAELHNNTYNWLRIRLTP